MSQQRRYSVKTMDEQAWRQAWWAAQESNYISIDDPSIANQLTADNNPEEDLLYKEKKEISNRMFNSLSDEAKQIINMILDSPTEIIELLGVKSLRGINPRKIESLLRKQWKNRRYASKVVKELINFVKIL